VDDLRAAAGQRVESINFKKDDSRIMEIYLAKKLLPEKVHFSDLVSHATAPYSFVVGKSMAGVVTASLDTTPHFMVAGATDGGKSVTFKSYLTGLLESSERIQFYLMDFKGTELNDFKGLPNVVLVKELIEGDIWLRKLVDEMERRYDVLAKNGHNKIDPERDNLDRIVIAIDECSEIGKVRRGEPHYTTYERMRLSLDKLARKARASGIHLMVATQKIDKATLDTRVQENIQGRLALRMDTLENSMRVLQNGKALGLPAVPGRAIWKKGADYVEVQTPYLSEEEIKNRVKGLISTKKFAHVKMLTSKNQDTQNDASNFVQTGKET
jgi:S-DNA-T family DNA segregation ATPase FtsK/SpoIIIE